jgi:hypothetical protein
MTTPPTPTAAPPVADVVKDLEEWRRAGVLQLRHLRLAALAQAALATGLALDSAEAAEPATLLAMVRSAIAPIATSSSGRCATVLLGLDPDTFDLAPNLLREDAAEIYGVSLERFRREPQARILEVVANRILEECYAHRARVQRLAIEGRHPADSRLAVHWLERFEAYFTIWSPTYALGADLTAYRITLLDPSRPYDRAAGTEGPDDPGYVQELQAEGYGTFTLFHLVTAALAGQRFITRYGGLWLLSSASAEFEARDALQAVFLETPMNERDDSWLRVALDDAAGELHPFLVRMNEESIGRAIHEEWQDWLSTCQCTWMPSSEVPLAEYFPTGRYHSGIVSTCAIHRVVEATNRFCTLIEQEWLKVADWYNTDVQRSVERLYPPTT